MTIVRSGAVSSAALAGQPARLVVRQLRREGLRVRVEWALAQGSIPAGTIISVAPEGVVEAGTVITLMVAAPPGG
jgi:methylaspartate ammonia-lyase